MLTMDPVSEFIAWPFYNKNLNSYLDKIPAWTAGCKVFTRPPSISGALVMSETSSTLRPALRRAVAVPPLAINCSPTSDRALARGSRPVLSDTLRRAAIIKKYLIADQNIYVHQNLLLCSVQIFNKVFIWLVKQTFFLVFSLFLPLWKTKLFIYKQIFWYAY